MEKSIEGIIGHITNKLIELGAKRENFTLNVYYYEELEYHYCDLSINSKYGESSVFNSDKIRFDIFDELDHIKVNIRYRNDYKTTMETFLTFIYKKYKEELTLTAKKRNLNVKKRTKEMFLKVRTLSELSELTYDKM